MGMQHGRGIEDDEEGNNVGKCHPSRYRRASSRAARALFRSELERLFVGGGFCSSTSCDACQKNRYGLIVVPNTAINAVK